MLLALEIRPEKILVSAARPSASETEITQVFSVSITDLTDAAIGERLKTELAGRNLSRADAILIVDRASVEMREFDVPPAPENELPDIVRFVSKNEFASLNENWLLDFIPLKLDSAQARKVLAIGLAPEKQLRFKKIAELAGIKLKSMLLRPLAKFDAIKSELADDLCRLVVDPGSDPVDMIVAVGDQVVATRSVRSTPELLDNEITRTIASARSSIGNKPVSEILLFGDPSEHQILNDRLSKRADVKFRFLGLQEFPKLRISAKLESPKDFVASFGALATQGVDAPYSIDFLHPRRPKIEKKDRSRQFLYGGIAAGAAVLAILVGWWTLRSQSVEIARLNQRLTDLTTANAGGDNRPAVDQILGEVATVDGWQAANVNWLDELNQLSNRFLTPDDAIVDSVDAIADREKPKIVIRSRMVGIQKEAALLDSLYPRPYTIETPTTGVNDDDPSYPMSFDFTILVERDPDQIIKLTDAAALEAMKSRSSRLSRDPKTIESSTTENSTRDEPTTNDVNSARGLE